MFIRFLVLTLLLLHAVLLSWGAIQHSPGWNEVPNLVAGISHWQSGKFDLYRVNPPLVRMVASVPVLWADFQTDWRQYESGVGARPERGIQNDFIAANGSRVFRLVVLARWACIPFSLLGGYICFRWARELYGDGAGILALTLWSSSPNVIAHAQMIMPDAGAAALGAAAAYAFWLWLKEPNWLRTLAAGVALGLAELSKATWTVLFPLWPVLWVVWRWPRRVTRPGVRQLRGTGRREACQVGVILLLAVYVLNLGYGFESSFEKLGDYRFVSQALRGSKEAGNPVREGQNRFKGTCFAAMRVPLPKNYVMGIDLQKSDFEQRMWSYLGGEWRRGGWWYYYLYAVGIKVPLGTWILLLLTLLVGLFGRGYAANWRDELFLLAPLAIILTLVSSQTGFNHHLRYVLPIFPFAFIWMSKVARAIQFKHHKTATVAAVALLWSVGSSLWVYPHSLSYFNELVGGPKNGHAHLGGVPWDSNIDWGQDLLYLKQWLDKHPEARPLHLAFNGAYDASIAGIEYTPPPTGPQPGWHALSVNKIRSHSREYEYFLRFEPVAMAGYSIYIYHITLDEANRVRRELGLSEITAEEGTTRSLEPKSGREGG